jgi:hypothetical protein
MTAFEKGLSFRVFEFIFGEAKFFFCLLVALLKSVDVQW